MTTNLNAIAGPSKHAPPPKADTSPPDSPLVGGTDLKDGAGVTKPGLSVDENGEVIKVPAFLNKLFRCVRPTSSQEPSLLRVLC